MQRIGQLDSAIPEIGNESTHNCLRGINRIISMMENARLPVDFAKNVMDFDGTISTIVKGAATAASTAAQNLADIT